MPKKISNSFDVVGSPPPKGDQDGYGFEENPGIQPPSSSPETPGDIATNSTEPLRTNKGVPKKSKANVYDS